MYVCYMRSFSSLLREHIHVHVYMYLNCFIWVSICPSEFWFEHMSSWTLYTVTHRHMCIFCTSLYNVWPWHIKSAQCLSPLQTMFGVFWNHPICLSLCLCLFVSPHILSSQIPLNCLMYFNETWCKIITDYCQILKKDILNNPSGGFYTFISL